MIIIGISFILWMKLGIRLLMHELIHVIIKGKKMQTLLVFLKAAFYCLFAWSCFVLAVVNTMAIGIEWGNHTLELGNGNMLNEWLRLFVCAVGFHFWWVFMSHQIETAINILKK